MRESSDNCCTNRANQWKTIPVKCLRDKRLSSIESELYITWKRCSESEDWFSVTSVALFCHSSVAQQKKQTIGRQKETFVRFVCKTLLRYHYWYIRTVLITVLRDCTTISILLSIFISVIVIYINCLSVQLSDNPRRVSSIMLAMYWCNNRNRKRVTTDNSSAIIIYIS